MPYQLGLRLLRSVGTGGFEPPTPRSRSECSTGLSHVPNTLPFITSGSGGIRTHEGLLTPTRFPIVLLKPLGHRSRTGAEGVGFEPTDALRASRFSKPLPWASRASLRKQTRASGGRSATRTARHCPSRARTWTFLIQSQACCQLHQGAPNTRSPLQGLFLHGRGESFEAGDGARTRDPQLGKLMLCQLSYSRKFLPNALQQSH